MSIVSVDNIQPIGSGTSVTVNSAATLVLNNVNSTGVVTATSFVGALPITGDTNNRVITATGSGGLNGEANLVFDGNFGVGTNSPSSIIHATGSNTSTGYQFINTHTTSGFGAFIKGGGTTADRYALRVDNAAGNEIFRVSANKRVGILSLIHISEPTRP